MSSAQENTPSNPGFDTLAIHAGTAPDPVTGARITPVYQTTAFVFEDTQQAADLFALRTFGNVYTRLMNPTQAALEGKVAALEKGTAALATASGHAAQMLVFHTLMQPGDHLIAAKQLYGGSINQLTHSFRSFGWNASLVDITNLEDVKSALTEKTKALFVESLSNPSGMIVDLEPLARLAEGAHIPLIVDNTMATPYLCRPLDFGAQIVVHSLTKFMGGHGNSMGGAIVDGGTFNWSRDDRYPLLSHPNPSYNGLKLHETFGPIAFAIACRVLGMRDLGPCISPFNAFLILTGMETLGLRMQRHCDNALAVAQWLSKHPEVSWVKYSGLPQDPNHALMQKYMPKGAGAVMSFGVKKGYDAAVRVIEHVELFSHVANLGDTRSLLVHPASTTHSQLSPELLMQSGIGPELIRLSIGLETCTDIIADLDQALQKACA